MSFSADGNKLAWVGHDSSISVADATRDMATHKLKTQVCWYAPGIPWVHPRYTPGMYTPGIPWYFPRFDDFFLDPKIKFISHCYFTRLNLKKVGPLQFAFQSF